MTLSTCPGCGLRLPPEPGPVHRYVDVSPECWALFGRMLALHYENADTWRVHHLMVDAYFVQHGGAERRARQSVSLHLAALGFQIEQGAAQDRAIALRRALADGRDYAALPPPGAITRTIADVAPAEGPAAHCVAVEAYAGAVWADWAPHHTLARRLIAEAGV